MGYSQAAFALARRWPAVFRPAVSVVLSVYPYRRGKPHWVLLTLKEILGVRVSRLIEVEGFAIQADPFDGPGRTFWRVGLTEPEMRELVGRILSPGMVMFDVGAYVGQFSLVASRVCSGRIEVFAFEPTPRVFEQLERNIKANRCQGVTCIQAALSGAPGTAKFYFYPSSHDQNSLRPLAGGNAQSVDVAVESVDSVCSKHDVTRLDFIKIDVEGNELAVLQGARRTLAELKPLLTVEVSRHQRAYGYGGKEIRQLLNEAGYDVYRISTLPCEPYEPSAEEIDEVVTHFNILAVPREPRTHAHLVERGVLKGRAT